MANFCPKVYWNGIELWYNKGNDQAAGFRGSISYSTPHRLSNATGYTAYPTFLGCYSGNYPNIPSTRTIRIAYKYENRKLKFWTSTSLTPGGSTGPVCTEIAPTSETWDDDLGWVYEVTWPSTSNYFIITEDNKYERTYSYQNVHKSGITLQEFYPRWDQAYSAAGNSRIMYKSSGDWSNSLRYIRRWNGSSWKDS